MDGSVKLAVGLLLMTMGSVGMAQSAGGRAAAAPAASADPDKALLAGAVILSDTMGVDFKPYLLRLRADIQRNWSSLIPGEAKPPQLKKGRVGIRFTILPDGKIGSMKLDLSSGDVKLDKAAWYAITSEGMFPPLPKEFQGPLLELRDGFFYNTQANTAPAPTP